MEFEDFVEGRGNWDGKVLRVEEEVELKFKLVKELIWIGYEGNFIIRD